MTRYELSPKNLKLDDIGRYLSDKIMGLKIAHNDYLIRSATCNTNKIEYKAKAKVLKYFYTQLKLCNIKILQDQNLVKYFKTDAKVIKILHDLRDYFQIKHLSDYVTDEPGKNEQSEEFKSRNKANLSGFKRNFVKLKMPDMEAHRMHRNMSANIIKDRNLQTQLCNILMSNISRSNNSSNGGVSNTRNGHHSRSTAVSPSNFIHIK